MKASLIGNGLIGLSAGLLPYEHFRMYRIWASILVPSLGTVIEAVDGSLLSNFLHGYIDEQKRDWHYPSYLDRILDPKSQFL